MSRKKGGSRPEAKQRAGSVAPDNQRRLMIKAGLGMAGAAAGGAAIWWWIRGDSGSSSPSSSGPSGQAGPTGPGKNLVPAKMSADAANARRAAEEMLEHYTRDLNNPSAIIHAIRGFGRDFRLADGSSAVDHLCRRYALDKEIGGRRYVYFKRDAEVHENSFLKTFLEAGVNPDQPVTVGDRNYTLRDVAEGGKALFRCDPRNLFRYDADEYRYDTSFRAPRPPGAPPEDPRGQLIHEHLPWGIIAFSLLVSPNNDSWVNAYGEKIELTSVIDRSLAEYESTCALGRQQILRGEAAPAPFREEIKKYSCFGLHTAYCYLPSLRRGFGPKDLGSRVRDMVDLLTWRLKSDAEAIVEDYVREGKGTSAPLVDAFTTRALVKLYGHAFETINYAKIHGLVTFTPSQERRIADGERAMYESLVRLRAMDWGMLRRSLGDKFISDIIIALGHAVRGLRLPTPQNPDAVA